MLGPALRKQHHGSYADDLSELIEHLDLRDAILIGHSTGGDAVLKIYPGGSHGLAQTDAKTFNQDVLAFLRG